MGCSQLICKSWNKPRQHQLLVPLVTKPHPLITHPHKLSITITHELSRNVMQYHSHASRSLTHHISNITQVSYMITSLHYMSTSLHYMSMSFQIRGYPLINVVI